MRIIFIMLVINLLTATAALIFHLTQIRKDQHKRVLDKVISWYFIFSFLSLVFVLVGEITGLSAWLSYYAPFGLMYGAFLYFFTVAHLTQKLSWRPILIHSAIPFLAELVMIILLTTGLFQDSVLATQFYKTLYFLIPVSYLIYGLWGIRKIYKDGNQIIGVFDYVLTCYAIILLFLSLYFFAISPEDWMNKSDEVIDIGMMLIYAYFWIVLVLFWWYVSAHSSGKSGLHKVDLADQTMTFPDDNLELDPNTTEPKPTYEKSGLTDDDLRRYERKLDRYMANGESWRQQDLKLKDLAKEVNIPGHHITQVLNVCKGKNFNTYINEMRVDEACRRMEDNDHHISLIDIGYDSGFNSKTTFFRWFKKIKGMTPGEYLDGKR